MILDPSRQPLPRLAPAGPILWQTKVRFGVAVVAVSAVALAAWLGVLAASPLPVLACAGGYLTLVAMLHLAGSRVPRVRGAATSAMLLADLLLIFAGTALTSGPAHYERGLVLALVVVHVAALQHGRAYAVLVAAIGAAGYLAIALAPFSRGADVDWRHEVLSAAVFLVAATLFAVRFGGMRGRAARLVALFRRAGEGDLTQEYDADADAHPDLITSIGRAYNELSAHLQSLVLTDPLTGCLNRRGFDQALGREMARSSRAGSELALLAIDLDHFKNLNDRCGHLAGDAILRDLGAILRQSLRAGDVVARTGGEEFTLILPDTNAAGAFQLATRLCEQIRARSFDVGSRSLRITVSVGVAAAGPHAIDGLGQELKLRADQALYAAKRLGRDRVLAWNE